MTMRTPSGNARNQGDQTASGPDDRSRRRLVDPIWPSQWIETRQL